MFTTGAVFLPFFSLMTFLIAVPTGVKMFNWIATMWRGQLTFSTPLLFALGFLTMFLIGGINGAFSAAVPVDFALHDTYWVVAHLHYVLFGGSVFGVIAGFYYWFPKMTGRMLNETLGKIQFVLMFIGFNLTFFPMHVLGLAGMPRRIADYSSAAGWNDLNLLATIGGFTIAPRCCRSSGTSSSRCAAASPPATTRGRATRSSGRPRSPPPPYNFDHLPDIRSERPLFDAAPRPGRRGALSGATTMTTDSQRPDDRRPSTTRSRGLAHDASGRHQQPRPRDAAVHHLGGDVLLGPVRRLLQRPGQRPAVAARREFQHTLQILPLVGRRRSC